MPCLQLTVAPMLTRIVRRTALRARYLSLLVLIVILAKTFQTKYRFGYKRIREISAPGGTGDGKVDEGEVLHVELLLESEEDEPREIGRNSLENSGPALFIR